MNGLEWVETLQQFKPKLKPIISTGHGLNRVQPGDEADPCIRFLHKPYQAIELAQMLGECLRDGS